VHTMKAYGGVEVFKYYCSAIQIITVFAVGCSPVARNYAENVRCDFRHS
jgi:hypothetical protein